MVAHEKRSPYPPSFLLSIRERPQKEFIVDVRERLFVKHKGTKGLHKENLCVFVPLCLEK